MMNIYVKTSVCVYMTHHEVLLHECLGICVLLTEVSPRGAGGHLCVLINHHAPGSEDPLPLNVVSLPREGRGQGDTGVSNLQLVEC